MADDQQPPAQRYWFPYWTAPPQPPPPAPAPRPVVRPQLSRRDTRPAPQPSPPVTPSPSRRQAQPPQPATTPASKGAGAPPPPAQPQLTRLSSRPSPSPARAPPLSPIREPNARAAAPAPAPVPIAKEPKPAIAHPTAAHEVPKEKDIIIPQEKTIHEPPADTKPMTHSKAVEKENDKEKEKEKENEKDKEKKEKGKEKDKREEKDKEKEHKEKKEKDEEKEKKHKEKEKEKEKGKEDKEKEHKHKDKEDIKSKEVVGEHGSKLHKELKAGVADMVHKLGCHERPSSTAPGTTVITLAGENKGASMKIDGSAMADGKVDSAVGKDRRGHKLNGSVADGKEQAGSKGLTAFVNSNVQVINNSLLLQSSCNGGDPGVHFKLSTKSRKKGDNGEEAGGKSGSAAAAAPKK